MKTGGTKTSFYKLKRIIAFLAYILSFFEANKPTNNKNVRDYDTRNS
jgi:hypothetical protein